MLGTGTVRVPTSLCTFSWPIQAVGSKNRPQDYLFFLLTVLKVFILI